MPKVKNSDNLVVKSIENHPVCFPVSLKTFMKFTHYEECVNKYVKQKRGKSNPELAKQGLEKMYRAFYTNSQTRAECNVQIKACPKHIKDKLLQFAVTNGTVDLAANKNITSKQLIPEMQSETEQIKDCNLHIKPRKNPACEVLIKPGNPEPAENRISIKEKVPTDKSLRAHCVVKESAVGKQTSNKIDTDKSSLSKQNLRYPVSLKTFIKYTDHRRRVTKYVEKYWENNPQAPRERTRTDDDIAKEGIKVIYKDFYKNSESRAKLNMRIKPCPDEIKESLLQYAELIDMEEDNDALTPHDHQNNLNKNKNVKNIPSKSYLRYPVSMEYFIKYTNHNEAIDKYMSSYRNMNPQAIEDRTDQDVKKEALEILYKNFYTSIESRAKLNVEIKACPKNIKEKLLQLAEIVDISTEDIENKSVENIEIDRKKNEQPITETRIIDKLTLGEDNLQTQKCKKVTYVEQLGEKQQATVISHDGSSIREDELETMNPTQTITHVSPRDSVKPTARQLEKVVAKSKTKETSGMQNKTSSNNVNKNVSKICNLSNQKLRYPVSLKTFIKYTDHRRHVTKYIEKYWENNPQAPRERTRTDDDIAKEGIKVMYKDFYKNSESRTKLNMRIKPCPDEIKESLLQYAELIEMEEDNDAQTPDDHLNKNKNVENIPSKSNLRYPVSMEYFIKYTNHNEAVDKYMSSYRNMNSQAIENRTDQDVKKEALEILYKDFYSSIESRAKHNVPIKACPKNIKEKLLQLAEVVEISAEDIENKLCSVDRTKNVQPITETRRRGKRTLDDKDNVQMKNCKKAKFAEQLCEKQKATVINLDGPSIREKELEKVVANSRTKEASGMQNKTSSNNNNSSPHTLRCPVSLTTFLKYTDHKKCIAKYVEKYREKNPHEPQERALTDDDIAKKGFKILYKAFYKNSDSRAKLNLGIKPCPDEIKDKLLQYAEPIELGGEDNSQMKQSEKVKYANQLDLEYKVVSNIVEKELTTVGSTTISASNVGIMNPPLTTIQEESVRPTMRQSSIENWLVKCNKKNVEIETVNPPQTVIQVSPRTNVRSTMMKLIEKEIANCSAKEATEIQGKPSSNDVNKSDTKISNLSAHTLQCPVSLKTFLKYTYHSRHIAKYIEKYWEKYPQTTQERTRTDDDIAKEGFKVLYKAFYKNSDSRAKLNLEIKPCPNEIKDKLLQYAEAIEVENNDSEEIYNAKHKNKNEYCNLNKNYNKKEISSKSNLRYPVSLDTFVKYTHNNEAIDKYVANYQNLNSQAMNERIDDIKNEALEILYKDFYDSIESREKHNVQIKACPKHVKERLLQFAELMETNEENISNLKETQATNSDKNMPKSSNHTLVLVTGNTKITEVKESTGENIKAATIKESTPVEIEKVAKTKETTTVQNKKVAGVKETITVENEKLCQQAAPHKCSTNSQKLAETQTKVSYHLNKNSLTDEFLLKYIKHKLGDSTKHAEEILARIKNEVFLKTIEVPKPCADKRDKVHIQSVKILKPIEFNTDLQEAKELFFQKVDKQHTLPYIIRMNDGVKADVLSAILDMSFLEFRKYTRIHNAPTIYNDLPTLRRYYDFALIEQQIWPINLYMQINDLFEYLKLKGVQIKSKEEFSLAHISPKLLQWQDIMSVTNYDECVLRYYEEPVETMSDIQFANHLRQDYYKKCWIHEHWILEIPVLTSEAVLNLNTSKTVDLNETNTQLENDIEMQLKTYSQENVDMEINDFGDCGIFIDMLSKDLHETTQPQLESDIKTELDTCNQENADVENSDTVGDWGIFKAMQLKENLPPEELQQIESILSKPVENFIDMPNTQVQIDALPTETHVNSDPLWAERSTNTLEILNKSVETSNSIGNELINTSAEESECAIMATVKKEPLDKVLFMLDDKEEKFHCFALPQTVISIDEGESQNSNKFLRMEKMDFDLSWSPDNSAQELTSIPSTIANEDSVSFCEAQRLPSTLEEQPEQEIKNEANIATTAKESAVAAAATTAIPTPIANINIPIKTVTNTKTGKMVPQLTHGFRALPLTKVLKNVTIRKRYVAPSVTIASTSTSSTTSTSTASSFSVSQALATNCTLFESSQLHRAIEEHQIQTESIVSHVPQTTSNSVASTSSSFKSSSAQQVNELNELYRFTTSQQTLIYRSLEKFYYFEQLPYSHIAKHSLQTASLYERYMGAIINVSGLKTQLYGDCLNVIFPYSSPKILADIRLVLKSLRMYHYNLFEQKTYRNLSDDLRKRILYYLLNSTSIFLDSPVYLNYDSAREIGYCKPIIPDTNARLGRAPYNRPLLSGAIKPDIRNKIIRLKKTKRQLIEKALILTLILVELIVL